MICMDGFLRELDNALLRVRYQKGAAIFLRESALLGAAGLLLAVCAAVWFGFGERLAILCVFVLFIPGALRYFFLAYKEEERRRKIDEAVPDMLLLAASMPPGSPVEKVISTMAMENSGPLSEEFAIARRQAATGMPAAKALELMAKRAGSRPLERAVSLVVGSMDSGAKMGEVFREAADDFMETNVILRERAASTAIGKYTMLLAGGLLVPLILGLVGGMVSGFDVSSLSGLGIGNSEQRAAELAAAAGLGSVIYIIEYALLASLFAAFQEGRQGKAVLYACFLLPAGLAVYFIARGI